MEIASESGSTEIAQNLLEYFVEIENPHCFTSCIFVCYDLLKPDIVLYLAWRNNYLDFIIPYLAQVLREYTDKVDNLAESQNFGSFEDVTQGVPQSNIPPGVIQTMMNQNIPPNITLTNMPPNRGGMPFGFPPNSINFS